MTSKRDTENSEMLMMSWACPLCETKQRIREYRAFNCIRCGLPIPSCGRDLLKYYEDAAIRNARAVCGGIE